MSSSKSRKVLVTLSAAVAAVAGLMAVPAAQATTYTWTSPTTGTTNWSAATWTNGVPVEAADAAITFGSSSATNFTANLDAAACTLGASTTSFDLQTLNLNGNPASGSTSTIALTGNQLNFVGTTNAINMGSVALQQYTIANTIAFTNGLTFGGGGFATYKFNGVISGTGGIIKNGNVRLDLGANNNTYTGGTTLNAGKLVVTTNTALGSGTVILNGGELVGAGRTLANAIQITGDVQLLDNANVGAGSMTLSGTVDLMGGTRTLTIDNLAGATVTMSNAVSNGTLNVAGKSILVLSGTNTYAGGTNVLNGGTVQFNSAAAIGGTGANVTIVGAGAAGAGYAMDQAFLSRIATTSTGSAALSANTSTALDFSTFPKLSLGATGAFSYNAATLTPSGTTYRLGGGGGTLTIANSNVLTSSNDLVVTGTGSVTFGAAQNYSGGTTVTSVLPAGTGGILQTNILTGTSNKPFGSNAAITLNNGTLGLGTAATLAASSVMAVNDYDVTFKGQNTIKLAVGSGTSVTFAAHTLNQSALGNDVLLFSPSSSANFGTKEIVTVASGVPSVTNGMVAPYYIDSANSTFVTYGASGKTGFSDAATVSTATLNNGTEIFSGTTGYGAVNVWAAKVNGNNTTAGDALTIGSGGLILNGGNSSFNPTVAFGSAHAYIGGFGSSSIGLNGNMTGTGGVTFFGPNGVSVLNGTSGALNITGGITVVSNLTFNYQGTSTNVFPSTNTLTITKSGQLNLTRVNEGNGGQTFLSLSGEGAITSGAASTQTFKLDGGTNTGTTEFTGTISGAFTAFMKSGATTQILSGANTYGGTTTVNGGTLKIDANAGGSLLSTSGLTLGGGTFALLGKASVVTAQTLGAVTLNNSGYSSTLAVDGGTSTSTTLNLGAITASTAGTALNISTANGATVTTTQANTVNLLNARITLNGSDFALGNGGASAISAASTTALATTAGTDTNNSLATDNVTLASGSHTTNSLKITTTTTGQSLAIGSGNTLILTSGGLLATGAQDYSITGGTLKSNTATNSDLIVHQYGNGTLTIGSVIANGNGASTLTKAGTGVLTLTGTNTYTGSTYITAGTLSVSANNQLGAITSGQTVNLSNASTLQATNTFTMDNSGSNKRAVALGSGGGVLDVTGANTLTISGVVSGAGNLTKINTGTLSFTGTNTYTGATNITGGTLAINGTGSINGTSGITINGGTLQYSSSTALTKPISFTGTGGTLVLDGSSSYAGAMTITSGNTLGGHGTYSNTVTINSGATLSPGNSPGQITVGTLLLNSGSTSHMEIGGTTIGTQYDNVTITSNSGLTYGGLLEVVSFGGYNLDQAGTYNLFTLNSGTPSGDFSSVTVGGTSLANSGGVWTGVNGSSTYQFAESSGILTVTIPEPATVSLMFGVASMGLLARRRRQKH